MADRDSRYEVHRFWLYDKDSWDPRWWHKFGVPYLGGDEWGRSTFVVGFWFVGYLVWAWRTCWCHECLLEEADTDAR